MSENKELQSIYNDLSSVTQDALEKYPEILCQTGCNHCCKSHGSPITYAIEWEQILAHWPTLPSDIQAQIKDNFIQLKMQLQQTLKLEERTLQNSLFDTPCPFLIKEKCAIYSVRPLTCRAFGLTQHQSPDLSLDDAIYACNQEKDRWQELDLPMRPELPLRDGFFARLEALNPMGNLSLLKFFESEFINGSFSD